jgi:exodeoxyribonuclease VII large subunit
LGDHRRQVVRLASSYALREPHRVVRQWAQRLDDLRENLQATTERAIQSKQDALRHLKTRLAAHPPARELGRRREHLSHLAARLRALGPQGTLDRGYALMLDAAGHPISQAKNVREGQPVRIVLSKGTVDANVTAVDPDKTLLDASNSPAPSTAPASTKKTKARRKSAP